MERVDGWKERLAIASFFRSLLLGVGELKKVKGDAQERKMTHFARGSNLKKPASCLRKHKRTQKKKHLRQLDTRQNK